MAFADEFPRFPEKRRSEYRTVETPSASNRSFDLALSVAIFLVVAIAAGRVYRFPFKDETSSLSVASTLHLSELPRYLLNDRDLNKPPLSYLLYYAGWSAGLRAAGLRWVALGCTAGALAIWHWLTLSCLEAEIPVPIRLLIAILFGISPMALSKGDSIRWYPPLALAVATAFLFYLRNTRRWFLSGIAMGIAADFSFLAIVPFLSLCVHRYLVERKFRWKEEVRFFLFSGLFASLGFITFAEFLLSSQAAPDMMPRVLKRLGYSLVGFFGGFTLGLSQLWIVFLAVIATAYLAHRGLLGAAGSSTAKSICTLALLTAAGVALLTLGGFVEPQGYVFLTPMISALASIGFVYALNISPRLGSAAYAGLLVCSISVAANLRWSSSPFDRYAAPFGEVINFVTTNRRGTTTVVTTDYTIFYELSRTPGLCVALFDPLIPGNWHPDPCIAKKVDTVFTIEGFGLNKDDPLWRSKLAQIIQDKRLIAEANFGEDDDFRLRGQLSPQLPYPRSLMDVTIFR